MSSLSNMPYFKSLKYWNKRLRNKKYKFNFLITKFLEITAYSVSTGGVVLKEEYNEFPPCIGNRLPADPKLQIVVPVYIRTNKDINDLNKILVSISRQSVKPQRVFIIDDCSPVSFKTPEDIVYHRNIRNIGPAASRNVGIGLSLEANADIIAFTDNDCVLDENWVNNILNEFKNNKKNQILSGRTKSLDPHWFGRYHEINGTLNGRRIKNTRELLYGTTANLAITKHVAETIKFNQNYPIAACEDIDYCLRCNMRGYRIKHLPDMIVYHNYGYSSGYFDSLRRFIGMFRKYKKGEKILLKEFPGYYGYFAKTQEIQSIDINKAE